jgi:hypothetical protein
MLYRLDIESVVKQETKKHISVFLYSYVKFILYVTLRRVVRAQHKMDKIKEMEECMFNKGMQRQ